jgi:hypothetical protein
VWVGKNLNTIVPWSLLFMQKYGLFTSSIYGVHETIVWEVYTGIVLYDISYSVGWFLCNQCLSPLALWVRIPLSQGVLDTTLCDKVYQWLAQVCGFLQVLGFHLPIKHDHDGHFVGNKQWTLNTMVCGFMCSFRFNLPIKLTARI